MRRTAPRTLSRLIASVAVVALLGAGGALAEDAHEHGNGHAHTLAIPDDAFEITTDSPEAQAYFNQAR